MQHSVGSGGNRMPSHLFEGDSGGTPSRSRGTPVVTRQLSFDHSAYGTPTGTARPPRSGGASRAYSLRGGDNTGRSPAPNGTPARFTSIYDVYGLAEDAGVDHSDSPPPETSSSWGGLTPTKKGPFYDGVSTFTREDDGLLHSSTDDDPRGYWVTIFGFPPRQTDFILKHFQRYGTVLRHEVEIGQPCNWVHVQYQTELQAQTALSKNGKVIAGGTLMVGVVQCIRDASSMMDREARMSTHTRLRGHARYSAPRASSLFVTDSQRSSAGDHGWYRSWQNFLGYMLGY